MRTLTLSEYQTLPGVSLTDDVVAALLRLGSVIGVARSLDNPGAFDLTATSWIGVIELEDIAIEIRPKVPLDNILFMISFSLNRPGWHESQAELEPSDSLVEAVARLFATDVQRAIRRGVLHGYRLEEAALPVVRGRLRFDEQIRRRFGHFPPVEVRYDEFTDDILENQLIKAALTRVGQLRLRSDRTKRALTALDGVFRMVTPVAFLNHKLPDITYTRLNEHYRPAVELARLILRSTAFDVRHGTIQTTALLVDMNRVFEDFVAVSLRERLGATERTFPQGTRGRSLWLDEAGSFRLQPDLSWWIHGRCRFVGDVKYKRLEGDARNADLYQLLTYAIAANLDDAMVIYASGEAGRRVHEIRHVNKRLHVLTLDLSRPPRDIMEQISIVAGQIAGIAVPSNTLDSQAAD
jgi:5-methylcytosine-specific restriction enzyme subunit McrC